MTIANACGTDRESVFVKVADNYDFAYEGDVHISIPGSPLCGNVTRRAVAFFQRAAFGTSLIIEWSEGVNCLPLTQRFSANAGIGNLLPDSFSPFFLNAQDAVSGTFSGGVLTVNAASDSPERTIQFISTCRRLPTDPPCP